jgi:proteasome accessory factor A
MSEVSTYLKVGTTALVLSMIEENFLSDDLGISQPVRELHLVSHDPSLRHRIQLVDGRTMTALELQGEYLDRARKFVDDRMGDDVDEQTRDVLQRWESVLTRLGDDAMQLAGELDWVAKLRLLQGYRERDNLDWDSARLQLVDLQYSDIRPEKGLYNRLVSRGAFTTVLEPSTVEHARLNPPEDTRAYFRGECLRRYGPAVAAASWDSVIFDIGRESLVRVPMLEPQRGTKAYVGELLDRCPTAQSLIEALNSPG